MKNSNDMNNIINVKNLKKQFKKFVAVKDVSFDVKKGEFYGFLGPNGAGKSTTINMLTTLLKISGGKAVIAGYDLETHPEEIRNRIGIIFQEKTLDMKLTGYENLYFHSKLYNIDKKVFVERLHEVLHIVDLEDKMNKLVSTYSGGMKRRLEIARGLLHYPEILFLDEPTVGLDPQTRKHIWNYLLKLKEKEKITIFLTTHYMDEAEICDRIGIIDHGEIIIVETPANLKNMLGSDMIIIDTNSNEETISFLKEQLQCAVRKSNNDQVIIEVDKADQYVPKIFQLFSETKGKLRILSLNIRKPTLEDVFIKLTGHAIREESADHDKDSFDKTWE